MSQLLALTSAVFYGLGDFVGGFATRRMALWRVTAWSMLIGVALLIAGLFLVPAESVEAADLLWGAAAGVAGLVGLALLYSTLAAGSMTIVAPISGVTAAALPVVFDLVGGSALTLRQWFGIGLALAAVVLVGTDTDHEDVNLRIVARAVLAGAAFGIFFIALSQTSSDSGLWPLVGARTVALPLAFAAALATKSARAPRGRDLRMVAVLGGLDMSANIAIALALQLGPVGINSVLSSLYPLFTAIAAIVLLHERPTGRQILAVALAMGAIVALAL
jgi:drug/metabolite transporter (DMT)-like permease